MPRLYMRATRAYVDQQASQSHLIQTSTGFSVSTSKEGAIRPGSH